MRSADEVGEFEYPFKGLCGSLWSSGEKAERLHRYFLDNCDAFLTYTPDKEVEDITSRFSINCFAVHGRNWHKIADAGDDDEQNLTVTFRDDRGFTNVMYGRFYVSHLSFGQQTSTFVGQADVLAKYQRLFDVRYRGQIIAAPDAGRDENSTLRKRRRVERVGRSIMR
jgi:hypothetical protein